MQPRATKPAVAVGFSSFSKIVFTLGFGSFCKNPFHAWFASFSQVATDWMWVHSFRCLADAPSAALGRLRMIPLRAEHAHT
jgi:hypothetical protein